VVVRGFGVLRQLANVFWMLLFTLVLLFSKLQLIMNVPFNDLLEYHQELQVLLKEMNVKFHPKLIKLNFILNFKAITLIRRILLNVVDI